MRFIVTAIGSFSSNCVIRCLKAQGHYVVGCDIYEYSWLYESHICDVFFQAPLALKENQYIDFLLTIAEKERIDFIIPLTDVEIDVINKYRKVFLDNNIGLFIQTEECLSVVRNKYNLFSQFNEDDNINVPKTILANNLQVENGIIFPLVAKPINGRSSEGLYYISSEQDLKPILNSHKEYILQEKIAGPIYTVDYIRDIHGNDYSIPREELLRTKNGAGTTVRIVHDDILESSVSYIGGKLQIYHNGAFFLPEAGVSCGDSFPRDQMLSDILLLLSERLSEKVNCGAFVRDPDDRVHLPRTIFAEELDALRQEYGALWGKTVAEKDLSALTQDVLDELLYWDFASVQAEVVTLQPGFALWQGVYPKKN